MEKTQQNLREQEYSVSYGIVSLANEIGVDRIIKKADEKMLEHKKEYYRTHDRRAQKTWVTSCQE